MSTRVLVLGGSGMLGHKLWQVFSLRFETWVTLRGGFAAYARYGLFDQARVLEDVNVRAFDTVVDAVTSVRPDVVVNAVGITKQRPAAQDALMSISVNALFPHRLAALCQAMRIRLIHLSTDCVFSGRRDMYTESDLSDPEDLYGRSKLLGEVDRTGCLVLRTSMIGREVETAYGLVEWFLSQRGRRVQGYTNAVFSGFPTVVLAQIIADLIGRYPDLAGIYHVSSSPISKYELLQLLREAYHAPVEIEPFPDVRVNRSLDSSRFRAATGFIPQPWPEMIQGMAADPTPYDEWRNGHASGR